MEITLVALITRFLFGAAYTAGSAFVILGVIWMLARRSGVAFLPTDTNIEETEGGHQETVPTHEGGYPFSRIFGRRRQQGQQK